RGFTPRALAALVAYAWPGNVRELQSEVVHGVTMCSMPYVDTPDLKSPELNRGSGGPEAGAASDLNLDHALDRTIEQILQLALNQNEGNVSKAAKAIGVSRGKFYDLMERVRLEGRP